MRGQSDFFVKKVAGMKKALYLCSAISTDRGVAQLVKSAAVTLQRSSVRARSSLRVRSRKFFFIGVFSKSYHVLGKGRDFIL